VNLSNKHCYLVYLVISIVPIGRERGTNVGRRKMHAGFWRERPEGERLLERSRSVRIILKRILEK